MFILYVKSRDAGTSRHGPRRLRHAAVDQSSGVHVSLKLLDMDLKSPRSKRLDALLDKVLDERETAEERRVAKIIRQSAPNSTQPGRSHVRRPPRRRRGEHI